MADELVTLSIEGIEVSVPKGTLVVNAAKEAGVYIPVFCYHPKLQPVGMCRMCLVEIGRPRHDRETGEILRGEDGQPLIDFGNKLETACTTPVGEAWQIRTTSQAALTGQKDIVEYLLTSHPLDCPICDKGGECPLQELTMDFGSGKSRFLYEDKIGLYKAYPLGELITLDRERCIQCARCTRYQEEVVDDPVIGFEMRGRRLQIVTYSDPGFDSYFSGNTTDICPVGALTTNDFRFQARPWELKAAASICPHCPVGCNTTLNTRRQAKAGGHGMVQRVMPRQNESVNEIWICDKGRFAHHYAGSRRRIARPLIRKEDELVEASWDEALAHAAEGLKAAKGDVAAIAGGKAANEELFTLRRLVEGLDGRALLYDSMGGGEAVQAAGVGQGTDLGRLGPGDAILVIASDLHEEAPIWWLRVKQAAERGAVLVVANARQTRLDKFANHLVRYAYPDAVGAALGLLQAVSQDAGLKLYERKDAAEAAKALASAGNLVVFFGEEGLDRARSTELADACAAFLEATGHIGRAHSGLVPVWPRGNTQGAWDMGFRPAAEGLAAALEGAAAAYIVAADPAGDSPDLASALEAVEFLVVQELFITPTAEQADVVFPAQSFIEREGTYTSGERRVQRFYPAVPAFADARPDWRILAEVGRKLGMDLELSSAALIFRQIASAIPAYAGLTYQRLAEPDDQWPPVGGEDLYFGGTAYANRQGTGVQTPLSPNGRTSDRRAWAPAEGRAGENGLYVVPIATLYDHGITVRESEILAPRLAQLRLELNPADAERLGLAGAAEVELHWNGHTERLPLRTGSHVPPGAALLPKGLGVRLAEPVRGHIRPAGQA